MFKEKYIQNYDIFRTLDIFGKLRNIYDGTFWKKSDLAKCLNQSSKTKKNPP